MAVTRVLSTVIFVAACVLFGCGTQQAVTVPTSAPPVRSVIDPQWMGFGSPDWNWTLKHQDIRPDRWEFDLQPLDETFTYPNDDCTGCNHSSTTAVLTVYAPRAYDPAALYTGQEVAVNGIAGYYIAPRWPAGAMLAWQYADGAWATVHGRSETAAALPRMLDIADHLRPEERTPVTFPLSLSTLPVDMPLSQAGTGFNTYLTFDGCGDERYEVPVAVCDEPADRLRMQLDRFDDFSSHEWSGGQRREVYTIPVRIGGREGFIHESDPTEAAIKAAPGVIVVFRYDGSAERFTKMLGDVVWATDVADESTWPAVADWT